MKKMMVSLAALALLAAVVPSAEAGQRRHGGGVRYVSNGGYYSGGYANYGHRRTVVRRSYYGGGYGGYQRPYYAQPYGYSPYYGGGYYGAPGISLSFGGGHSFGGHGGGHH